LLIDFINHKSFKYTKSGAVTYSEVPVSVIMEIHVMTAIATGTGRHFTTWSYCLFVFEGAQLAAMQEAGQLPFRFEFCILVAGFVSLSCPTHAARLRQFAVQVTYLRSVAEPHHFYTALAPGKRMDAVPAAPALLFYVACQMLNAVLWIRIRNFLEADMDPDPRLQN
jgi:hypothetical protein